MSDLSRRRGRSDSDNPTTYCFCDSCDRVLYVTASAPFCPVCSSPVIEITPQDETALSEPSESSSS